MSDADDVVKDDDYWIQKNIEYREKLIQDSNQEKNNDNSFSSICNQVSDVKYDCTNIIKKIKG